MPRIDLDRYDAFVFDLDGVITDTAAVHEAAWKRVFDGVLAGRGLPAFTHEDYLAHVDGRPRYEGVATFLASRGVTVPDGTPADPPEDDTVCGIGNRKNAAFQEALDRDGVRVFASSVALLDRLDAAGVAVGLMTSSRNGAAVLERAGLRDRFAATVTGVEAAERGLRGKPAPDAYLAVADDLGVPAARAVVVEDAQSGVAAGRAGGFALVVGVDRGGQGQALREHGADVVVGDLGELELG